MTHQIIFSGHVSKNANKVAVVEDAKMACDVAAFHEVTGLTLFSDGNFLTVIEGAKDKAMSVFETIKSDPRFAQAEIIMSRRVQAPEFQDYAIGFQCNDFSGNVTQAFLLNPNTLQAVVPAQPSTELRVMLKTFARVNNLEASRFVA